MDRQAKFVVISLLALLVVTILFPPWNHTFQYPGVSKVNRPAGYDFILSPPTPRSNGNTHGVEIDIIRLAVNVIIVVVLEVIAIVVLSIKNKIPICAQIKMIYGSLKDKP